MSKIEEWLEGIGLGRYATAFVEHDIDLDVLPDLTENDLQSLGLSLGQRKRFLRAAALLAAKSSASASGAAQRPRGATELEAERRHLTVMFCDLVGSTALSTKLDPEDLREIIRGYQNACSAVIGRFDGCVARYMGDGIMVYFGYPHAHEDDAERAVRAGLGIVEAVSSMRPAHDVALEVRVGIATGTVVVGDIVGTDISEEQAVVGQTPNLAARIQAFAAPDTVAISRATWQLTGPTFDYRDLGAHSMKGFPDPIQVWQVEGESQLDTQFQVVRRGTPPRLVARARELSMLLGRWDEAKRSSGQVVLLCGEAGIGKSRIVRALQDRIEAQTHTRLRYQCSPYYANTALHPIATRLTRAAALSPNDNVAERRAKLEQWVAQWPGETSALLSPIARLLSIPPTPRDSSVPASSDRQKEDLFTALISLVERMSARAPVLLIFEDVHWIDPTSWEYLERLIIKAATLPVLVIVTFRPEFKPPLTATGHVNTFTLDRLSPDKTATLVNGITGGKALPAEVLEQILAKTDGVPLFIEELTKMVVESGLLIERGDAYELTRPLPPLAIPITLQDSLMARLDRLAPVKEVAQIGAALGREFDYELLAHVSLLDEDALRSGLIKLADAELIFRNGAPPHSTYTFKHALVQDAAYSSMLRSKRKLLHARIADVLESYFPERVKHLPEILAHHCTQAQIIEKAAHYWAEAARGALAGSAAAESLAQVSKGLEVVSALGAGADRDRLELELQTVGGWASIASHGYTAPQTGDAFTRARHLCDHRADAPERFPVLFGQWSYHLLSAEVEVANEIAEEMIRTAEQRGDSASLVTAHRVLGTSSFWLGRFDSAHTHLQRALALYDPQHHRQLDVINMFDTRVVGLDFISLTLFPLGYPAQALARNQQTLAEAERSSELVTMAIVLQHGCLFHQLAGYPDVTERRAEALLALARKQGYPFWLAHGEFFRSWALAAREPDERHADELRHALEAVKATRSALFLPYYSSLLAEACGALGRTHEASELLDDAISRIEATGERWFEPEVHRLRGTLGSPRSGEAGAKAKAHLHNAIGIAHRQGAKLWQLRAATSLAAIELEQNEHAAARTALEPVYRWFSEGFDTPDLERARALLERID